MQYKKLAFNINLALAAACYPLLAESAPLEISQKPLAGIVLQYAPNLVLALSVEFPTAGPAYTTIGVDRGREITHTDHLKMLYRGYFDPEKCYTYNGKHFEPVAKSQQIADRLGMCPGADHFSGSFMNFMTASALDVFRQTLTGGNRAYGTGVDHSAYKAGDTLTETYVRRSQPGSAYTSSTYFMPQHSTMKGRRIDLKGATGEQINQLLPNYYASSALKDITDGILPEHSTGLANQRGYRRLSNKNYSFPSAGGFNGLPSEGEFPAVYPNDFNKLPKVDENDRFADHYLYFTNTGFGVYAYRRMLTSNGKEQYFAIAPNMQYETIVVRVCKPGFLEENCVKYSDGNYKPEGLLQKYARTGMRVAAFGYLNVREFANSPVLRSRMKHLDRTETVASITYGQEWDQSTGQFFLNPDITDANASGVQNSGVINYLNKFGDVSGYKQYDIGAELYYAALRYLRGGANGNFGNLNLSTNRAHYVRTSLDEKMKDGFPAIYNWDDPILRGLGATVKEAAQNPQAQCRTNSIIYIGDTNTWEDRGLPNFDSPGFNSGNFDNIQTKTYLQALLAEHGLGANDWNTNRGARNSPSGMAGLAYWARVNDIRGDIPGTQSGNNFILDVVEVGNPKGLTNTYWMAAKYGGFDLAQAADYEYAGEKYKMPLARASWTDDAPDTSSIPGFFGNGRDSRHGIPRNFGVANNPDNMQKSLVKAFENAGKFDKPSQSSIGLTVPAGEKIDLTAGALIISSTFDAVKMTGDLILSRIRFNSGKLEFDDQWRSSTKLNSTYHDTGNAWANRNVFIKDGGSIKELQNVTLPGTNGNELRRFVLGSNEDEGILWRKRESIMGTTVYGAPVSILAPSQRKLNGENCEFDPSVLNREVHYAVAANDGMFHIFDSDGDEKIAYIPSTALPKLEASALPNAAHQFLNDGSAIYADVCFNDSTAKSVIVANTGRGGSAVYALDVTDLSTVNASKVLWEFSSADDADLGLTVGKVSISKNAQGKPIAVFSSGFNNVSEKGFVFVLDISNTGSWVLNNNYWKIPLDTAAVQGVGEPFVYDKNLDGIADHVYVGDFNGKLWRVDHNADDNTWMVANGAAMFSPDVVAPITGSPFVQNIRGKTYVTFGTGQYLNDDGVDESVQNYAYGLIDDGNATAIKPDAVLEQAITKVAVTFAPENGKDTRELWEISGEEFDENVHRGWRLKLQKGQTIIARPIIRGGEVAEYVAVSRGSNDEDVCAISGSTSIISLSLRNGGSYSSPLFDTTGDGFVDGNDTLGGMVTIHGQVSPYAIGFDAIIDGKKTYYNAANSDTGNWGVAGKIFSVGSVMIRTSHREVPL